MHGADAEHDQGDQESDEELGDVEAEGGVGGEDEDLEVDQVDEDRHAHQVQDAVAGAHQHQLELDLLENLGNRLLDVVNDATEERDKGD